MLGAELFHCNGNKNVIELWSIFNKTKSFLYTQHFYFKQKGKQPWLHFDRKYDLR